MEKILSRRLPLAWLLIWIIALAGVGIVTILISQGAAPQNAVLIESVDEEVETRPTSVAAAGPVGNSDGLFSPDGPIAGTQIAPTPTPGMVAVYVSGAVNSPGVYSLPPGSRVDDALKGAGGASSEADLELINLAAFVSDQEHIRVPRIGEILPAASASTSSRPKVTATSTRPSSITGGVKLDLNSATSLELEDLPGIGPVLAARIVADRDTNGPFRSVDDLKRVPGIKDALLLRFREFVTVQP